ncbi:unnamed protein product [Polarella glacialis]|uniref:Uncharacterized protein n=1 Tax=Polarella glacialis TaxID=89957 RepID=A0A813ID45_POLGL|nr:unnamed protein product [Polarella glacialis]CAE8650688.1 unnamed protein product [Polarella glacialis]
MRSQSVTTLRAMGGHGKSMWQGSMVRAESSIQIGTAPDPWTAEGGCDDFLVPFDELLSKLSKARPERPPPRPAQGRAPLPAISATKSASWKLVPAIGGQFESPALLQPKSQLWSMPSREGKDKAWKPAGWEHSVSSFGQRPGFLRARERELSLWDQERVTAPERNWPSGGAAADLYDNERKDQPSWNPVSWDHTGRCFPMEPPPVVKSSGKRVGGLSRAGSLPAARAHSLTRSGKNSWSNSKECGHVVLRDGSSSKLSVPSAPRERERSRGSVQSNCGSRPGSTQGSRSASTMSRPSSATRTRPAPPPSKAPGILSKVSVLLI